MALATIKHNNGWYQLKKEFNVKGFSFERIITKFFICLFSLSYDQCFENYANEFTMSKCILYTLFSQISLVQDMSVMLYSTWLFDSQALGKRDDATFRLNKKAETERMSDGCLLTRMQHLSLLMIDSPMGSLWKCTCHQKFTVTVPILLCRDLNQHTYFPRATDCNKGQL